MARVHKIVWRFNENNETWEGHIGDYLLFGIYSETDNNGYYTYILESYLPREESKEYESFEFSSQKYEDCTKAAENILSNFIGKIMVLEIGQEKQSLFSMEKQ